MNDSKYTFVHDRWIMKLNKVHLSVFMEFMQEVHVPNLSVLPGLCFDDDGTYFEIAWDGIDESQIDSVLAFIENNFVSYSPFAVDWKACSDDEIMNTLIEMDPNRVSEICLQFLRKIRKRDGFGLKEKNQAFTFLLKYFKDIFS